MTRLITGSSCLSWRRASRLGRGRRQERASDADRFMEHLALWEGDGTGASETTWLEPVTEEQYSEVRTNGR